ncbi:MAG: oxalyl-CoA decarboxylase [Chloroflexi bacterium]|nr:oxalyl-CoA decarboxylase [Chloroflexota bacterium]
MATINGATLLARSLKQQGVEYMFGIVGFPVQPIAGAAQREGITFIGMRNEQAASYAAHAAGYLTGRPQACLVVSGPGVVHALAGLANAQSNCWPMILIGGASPTYQNGMGAFQEAPQVKLAEPYCKYAHAVEQVDRIPYYVEQAVRSSIYGRPGATYLDMPDDIIRAEIEEEKVEAKNTVPPPPRTQALDEDVESAVAALKSAERPLVIVGKGMAWSRAENEVREFIERSQLPFLATPMGKGVMPDDHPLSVGAARSFVLQNADVVFLLGARLNWILHYGLPPRYSPNVRVVQLDIAPEEIGANVPAEVGLVGDGKAVMRQVNRVLESSPWQYPSETTWRSGIANKIAENRVSTEAMMADDSSPMNYYHVLSTIRDMIPRDTIIASEGANTMDIGRTILNNYEPRTRLDAGTFGTMGVGLGFAIAASVTNPTKRIIDVEGDSAFGFSGMEVETACRHKMPITFIIINNNGIGGGPTEFDTSKPLPPNAYTPSAHYEKMMDAFGGKGYFVTESSELKPALEAALNTDGPSLVNIMISNRATRKPQEFRWLTT